MAISGHSARELQCLLLGVKRTLQVGVTRDDIDEALSELLDDIERQIAKFKSMGGPLQGRA